MTPRSAIAQNEPSVAKAYRFFREGRLTESMSEAETLDGHHKTTITARCLIRLGKVEEAQICIENRTIAVSRHANDLQRGELAILRGTVASKVGDRRTTARALSDATAYLTGTDAEPLLAELINRRAALALELSDFDSAMRLTDIAIASTSVRQRVAARSLQGVLLASEGDLEGQHRIAWLNYDDLEKNDGDVWQKAGTLTNLSLLESGIALESQFHKLTYAAEKMPWNSHMSAYEVRVFALLAECARQKGDWQAAFDCTQRSLLGAITRADRIVAMIAACDFALVGRDYVHALGIMTEVVTLARFEFETLGGIPNSLLDIFSVVCNLALISPATGRWAFNAISSFKYYARDVAATGSAGPTRLDNTKLGTLGIILFAEGKWAEGRIYCELAFSYLRSLGMEHGALIYAVALAKMTGADEFMSFMTVMAEKFPHGEAQQLAAQRSLTVGLHSTGS